MCGIAGIFSASDDPGLDNKTKTALRGLSHRGPDGESQVAFELTPGQLHMGHRRLAIIDLSDQGLQPMLSACGRYWIVFNGEIYNYREIRKKLLQNGKVLRTETDTEVLLEAFSLWGTAIVPTLIGMFAFTIYDVEQNTLECFRDAFGIKPFFYSHHKSFFAFASEAKAVRMLAPIHIGPDHQRAFDYLSMGRYDDKPRTFFERVSHLEPGCYLKVKLGPSVKIEEGRWWNPSITEHKQLSFSDSVDLVRSEFLKSIKLHLRSDVPFGAALSGGVDSSALVCAMRYLEPDLDIHTFSYVAGEGATSEEEWVDLVNSHVNAIPHKISIARDDLFSDLDDMIVGQGEPFGSTSIYASYRVYKMVRDAGVVVCLDGQGADEMFAGYHGYPHLRLRSLLENGGLGGVEEFLTNWARWPGRSRSDALKRLVSELLPQPFHSLGRKVVGRSVIKPWINAEVLQNAGVKLVPYLPGHRKRDARGRRLVEYERFLLGHGGLARLLRHGDRNSMRWSIESRVPFLTTGLAELALSLPEEYLISNQGETKSVLRAALRDIVPDAILDRRDKVGFETPEVQWLSSDKLNINGILESASELGFFEMDQLRNEMTGIITGERPFSSHAWRVINYCKWADLVF